MQLIPVQSNAASVYVGTDHESNGVLMIRDDGVKATML